MKQFYFFLSLFLLIFYTAHSQNVGVGESSPQHKLDVAGDLRIQGNIVRGGASGSFNILSNGGFRIDLDEDNNGTETFRIANGSNSLIFTVTEGGNVSGTGNADFNGNLTLSGNNRTISTGDALDIMSTSGIDIVIDSDNSGTGSTFLIRKDDVAGPNLFRVDEDGDATVFRRLKLNPVSTQATGAKGDMYFDNNLNRLFYHDGTAWREVVSSNNVPEVDPEVGINISNFVPRWNGSNLTSGTIQDNGANIGIGIAPNNTVKLNVGGMAAFNNNDIRLRDANDANHLLGFRSSFASTAMNGPLLMGFQSGALATNNGGDKIALFWNDAGRVGIGTSNPQRSLEVNNAIRLTNNSSDLNDGIIGTATFAPGLNIVGINTDGGSRKISFWGGLQQQENLNSNSFIGNTFFPAGLWNTNGNVGIGTTIPSNRLHVAANESGGIDIGAPNDNMGFDGGAHSIRFYGYRDVINNAIGAKISAERTNLCCGWLSQGTELAFYTSAELVTSGTADNPFDNSVERVRIRDSGTLEAKAGFRTQKKYTYYRARANEDNAFTHDIGNHDICYLAGVSFFMDNNVTWDIDNQCNVFPTDWNATVWGDGGANGGLDVSGPVVKAFNEKPRWNLYLESFIDNDAVYCGAICIDFD